MRARQTSAPQIARSRNRGLIPLLVASAVLVALGIFLLVRMLGDDVKSGGPIAPPEGSAAVATPVDLNAPYSWGLIYLRNEGDDSAHVEGLDLGQIPSGLRVLGSYAVPGNAGIGFGEGYHPGDGRPVVGLTIPPTMTYNVVVGLSATARGRHVIPEARVRYASGGTTYEATFNVAVVLCAPKADYSECPSTL